MTTSDPQVTHDRKSKGTKSKYNYGLPGQGKKVKRRFKDISAPKIAGEVVFGLYPVYLALRTERRSFSALYMKEGFRELDRDKGIIEEIVNMCQDKDLPIEYHHPAVLSVLSQARPHQGVCLDASGLKYQDVYSVDTLLRNESSSNLWLFLESIKDPMNFGAVLRSSYFMGVDKIFTPSSNSCKLSPVVSKASAGALEVMDLYKLNDIQLFIKQMKDRGWQILGTSGSTEKQVQNIEMVPLEQVQRQENTLLLLGNEGKGLSPELIEQCDQLVCIKAGRSLPVGLDSLNVSVATGIIIHHLKHSVVK